jgi:hypothetical protein
VLQPSSIAEITYFKVRSRGHKNVFLKGERRSRARKIKQQQEGARKRRIRQQTKQTLASIHSFPFVSRPGHTLPKITMKHGGMGETSVQVVDRQHQLSHVKLSGLGWAGRQCIVVLVWSGCLCFVHCWSGTRYNRVTTRQVNEEGEKEKQKTRMSLIVPSIHIHLYPHPSTFIHFQENMCVHTYGFDGVCGGDA